MALAPAIDLDETAMALRHPNRRSAGYTVVQPKMRYNAALRKINLISQQFERPHMVVIDTNISESLTGADIGIPFVRLEDFTTALSDVVIWDDCSLRATFSALSEGYDVAATEEASLSATKHFGW